MNLNIYTGLFQLEPTDVSRVVPARTSNSSGNWGVRADGYPQRDSTATGSLYRYRGLPVRHRENSRSDTDGEQRSELAVAFDHCITGIPLLEWKLGLVGNRDFVIGDVVLFCNV